MSEKFAPPTVTIRRYLGSRIYEVVVVVRRRKWSYVAKPICRHSNGRVKSASPTTFPSQF
jgi:hypothetical protein